jgi:hypothetical protein
MKGFEVKNRRSRVNLTCKREVGEMTAPEYTCPREASLNRSRTPGGLARSPSIASPTPASWHNLSQLYSSLQAQACWPDDRQPSRLLHAVSRAEKGIVMTVLNASTYCTERLSKTNNWTQNAILAPTLCTGNGIYKTENRKKKTQKTCKTSA